MKKKFVSALIAMLLSVFALTGCGNDKDRVLWTLYAPPGSSALYPLWVAFGNAIHAAYPNYIVTVAESQGAIAITKGVKSGFADFGNCVASTDYESYNGLGVFKGKPNKDARILYYYDSTLEIFCVPKDSDIKDFKDLDGKRYNPGGTGTTAEDITKKILGKLNVKPDYFTASQADAADAYANHEIVGTTKLGPARDSYVMQLGAAIPVRILSMSDEQIKTVRSEYPYLLIDKIPANTYNDQDYVVNTLAVPQGCQTTKRMSQEDGYKICKAIFDTQKPLWVAAYPKGAKVDMIKLTLSSTVPLHAGTVQYFEEIGVKVPEKLIPPEYVPVKK